jgi:hypothetical protein
LGWGSISKIQLAPKQERKKFHHDRVHGSFNAIQFCCTPTIPATTSHLSLSSALSNSKKLPLTRPCLGASCNTILDFFDGVNRFHVGDHLSLNLFGSPARTNDTQYAMSSSAKSVALGDISENVPVPFALKKGGRRKGKISSKLG